MKDVAREVKGRRPAYTCARATFFSAAAHDQVPSQAAPMTARRVHCRQALQLIDRHFWSFIFIYLSFSALGSLQ